jgi:tRNA 2-thiouridine synthesizing protein E
MNTIQVAGKNIELDDAGFLKNSSDWDKDVALEIAKREGFDGLDAEQFEIIFFMREYYKKFHSFPIMNYVCKNLHQPRQCITEEFINPMKAWKIAGLPKQDDIQFVAVDGKHFIMQECC